MNTRLKFSSAHHYDAVVIGARCAGAATALLLARAGWRVLNVDRSPAGADTLSTHALMRGGLLQLQRWGLLPQVESLGAPGIDRTAFYYGNESISVPIKPKHGVHQLYAPRRHALDALLARAALEAGAEVRHRVSLVDVMRTPQGRVTGAVLRTQEGRLEQVRARLVIGADGARSRLAQLVQAQVLTAGRYASTTLYGYFPMCKLRGYHWHYGKRIAAGAIPTSGAAACVFVGLPPAAFAGITRANLEAAFRHSLALAAPALAEQLRTAAPLEPLRAFAGMRGFLRRSYGPGWALVGDAGYFKDPGTAHGMTDALRDAELLVRAIRKDPADLSAYQQERDELSRPLFELSDRIASFDWTHDELKQWHRSLSREMNREADHIAAWDRPASIPIRSSAISMVNAHRQPTDYGKRTLLIKNT